MAGKLFLIVGPSGVGKTALLKRLALKHPEFYFPPSATTRPRRENEINGKQYFFLTPAEFEQKKSAGEFLEVAVVHKRAKYGTLKKLIAAALTDNKVILREVDIQGLQAIRQKIPAEKIRVVFIIPPNLTILKKRILRRQNKISATELDNRLQSTKAELRLINKADFQIVSVENQMATMLKQLEDYIQQETSS